MKKGFLTMGLLLLTLSNSAVASLEEAETAPSMLSRDVLNCNSMNFSLFANEIARAIDGETSVWRERYREIEESDSPESYFDSESMAKLDEANLFVRKIETNIKGLAENLVTDHGTEIPDRDLTALRNLRISISKLRSAITSIVKVEHQLRPAVAIR
ncbi:hypothetical protein [Vibrio sp. A1-1]|uniref:hypothetical protein n=1 Tax=Vibrio sp. A1-1 TaxID=2912250 RepID=UPI001F3415AC|nr:hypothetical protein [Vibrio sp. A1-1]EHU0358673.1 hypothetical protein [Vibrio parahaemolyticus]MCF7455922.1 hypothetical protein [Vibrio sp. A1-1]